MALFTTAASDMNSKTRLIISHAYAGCPANLWRQTDQLESNVHLFFAKRRKNCPKFTDRPHGCLRAGPSGEAPVALLVEAAAATATSESVGWQNFGKMLLVFGCIGSDFLQENMRFAAFFKSYQILKLIFLKFDKILQILRHLQFFAEISRKLLFFQTDFLRKI